MKALVIFDSENDIEKIDACLKECGYEPINYKWLIKAMDNVEEINPDLICVSVKDYPRHWKILAQYIRGDSNHSNAKIALYVPSDFSEEEMKKAKALGICCCFCNLEKSGLDELKTILSEDGDVISVNDVIQSKEASEENDMVTVDGLLSDMPPLEEKTIEDFIEEHPVDEKTVETELKAFITEEASQAMAYGSFKKPVKKQKNEEFILPTVDNLLDLTDVLATVDNLLSGYETTVKDSVPLYETKDENESEINEEKSDLNENKEEYKSSIIITPENDFELFTVDNILPSDKEEIGDICVESFDENNDFELATVDNILPEENESFGEIKVEEVKEAFEPEESSLVLSTVDDLLPEEKKEERKTFGSLLKRVESLYEKQ